MSREIILEALNGIRDTYIEEAAGKLGLVAVGAATAGVAATTTGAASNAMSSEEHLFSLSGTETATKTGFGAWLAKGGWITLVAGAVAVAGIAAGAFFLSKSGDVPPAGSETVTAAGQEQSSLAGDVTEESTEPETSANESEAESTEETATEDETEEETEAHVHSFGDWQFVVTPTCTESGVRARTCASCSAVEQEDMPSGLHTFDRRTCTLCGEKMTDMEFTSYGDGTCCLKDAGRVRGDMVIPNYSPEGDLVIAIGENAFSGSFDSLVWPEKLTSIGEMAFSECKLPEGFTLPDGLTSIGKSAFAYCRGITKMHIPASVTEIGQNAFEGVTTLTEISFGEGIRLQAIPAYFAVNSALSEITLPDSVTSIGSMAFAHTALPEFHLPDGVARIEAFAFTGCTRLTAVHNTDGLTFIGQEAFAECSSLTDLHLPECLEEIGYHAFRGCISLSYSEYDGGYYLKVTDNPYAIMAYGRTDVTEASLHPNTRIAVGGAFEGNTSLTSFTFPDSTTEISDRFFYGCTSLTSVNMPSALTRVGNEAFYQCYTLPNLTLPEGVLTVGERAFLGCHAFTEMILPDSITEIGVRAFEGCRSMTSVKLPASLTAISHGLFDDCSALSGTLVIPEGVTSIGSLPFHRCTELITLVLPCSVVRFEEQVFFTGVYDIEYAGTMAEWEAIEKDDNWRAGRATLQAVICTDGRIDFN
ncbi:MAG: leucine-rich repeat domain-containing protein [Clostridia bacterium]|nr:leucine-rich repeat domain-containing protein [Clostridia bacterium]